MCGCGSTNANITTVPTYIAPTKKNTPSMPSVLTSGANRNGPITVDPDIRRDWSTTAFIRCLRGTRFGTMAWRQGMSNDSSTPFASEIARRCHGSMISVAARTPVSNAVNEKSARVVTTNRIRLTRSATTPPHIDRINIGPRPAKVTRPSISGESVSWCISHSRPAMSAQMPMFEKALPIQNRR